MGAGAEWAHRVSNVPAKRASSAHEASTRVSTESHVLPPLDATGDPQLANSVEGWSQ